MKLLRRAVALLTVVLAIWVVASTVLAVAENRSALPFRDHWAVVTNAMAIDRGAFGALAILQQHNEHCIAVPRLLLLLDSSWLAQTGIPVLAVTLLLQGLHAWLLLRLALAGGRRDRATAFATGAMLGVGTFAGVQLENFVEPFQVQFALVFAAATAAFAALARAAVEPSRRRWLAIAIAAGVIATLSMGNGVIVWPMLLAAGFALRLPRRALLILLAAAAVVLVPYVATYHRPGPSDPLDALTSPREAIEFALCVLGSAFRLPDGIPRTALSIGVGLASVLLFGAGIAWHRRTVRAARTLPPADVALIATGVFLLASAGVTAAARLHLGTHSAMAGRYATPSILFAAVAVVFASRAPGRWLRPIAVALAVLMTTGIVLEQRAMVASLQRFRRCTGPATLAVLTGVHDAARMRQAISPHQLEQEWEFSSQVAFLRERRRSVFADGRDQVLGQTWSEVRGAEAARSCAGSFDAIEPVAETGWGLFARGRATLPAGVTAPTTGVFVDADDRIVGLCDARPASATNGDPGDRDAGGRDSGDWVHLEFEGFAAARTAATTLRCALGGPGGWWLVEAAGAGTVPDLADGGGDAVQGAGATLEGAFALLDDALAQNRPEAAIVRDGHLHVGLSTAAGTGLLRVGPIVGGVGEHHTLGIPVLTGPMTFGLRIALIDDATNAILRTLRPAPTFGEWRTWRVAIPKESAGRRLSVVAVDRGDRSGQWLALAMPVWLPSLGK